MAMKKVAAANRVAEEASVCVEPTVADPDPGENTKMDISYKIDFAVDDDDTNGVAFSYGILGASTMYDLHQEDEVDRESQMDTQWPAAQSDKETLIDMSMFI